MNQGKVKIYDGGDLIGESNDFNLSEFNNNSYSGIITEISEYFVKIMCDNQREIYLSCSKCPNPMFHKRYDWFQVDESFFKKIISEFSKGDHIKISHS